MVEQFIQHIRVKNLLDENKSYLLAISGGLDSVCLGHLLRETGIDFEMAHVNFGLRGDESDGDEAFVNELSKQWGKKLHIKKIVPEEFDQRGQSTQMTARKLRYDWFEELCKERGLNGVLVAHHFSDQIETVLLNLLRGTGIEGVYGMADKKAGLIRPLLPFERSQLEAYLLKNGHSWRHDSSNDKSVYKRNFIRNEVFPLLESSFPQALTSLDDSFKRLRDTGKAFFHLYDIWKADNIKIEGDSQYLPIRILNNLPGKSSLLYYWLRDYGFNIADVEDLIDACVSGEVGKVFHSENYFLNLDRDYLILSSNDFEWEEQWISVHDISLRFKFGKYDLLHLQGEVSLDKDSSNAMLDKDKLSFPLRLRKWELGDKFVPLGMQKEKKISDFLIDLKVPLVEKKKIAVLLSGEEIVWVVGHRISEHFKYSKESKNILYIKKR
ncbi:tRNA lysidine(34) synthetase TilS [Mongoliibacter ruber]|uniref:tRNA(Ile)-lysidine synthase n=1 Tax=Mongoliibacter ruber TaxID=1750599 RepID=A0A2T0WF44_9BACT|nr:tRNA lysidine(34) synthetase TilS [Mongoliibacter ruber]PRY85329.1 tRNA(Ile)-lysidine synthase [Mongoliibacter ruber]